MITKEQALALKSGQILHHVRLKNADKTPLRARVNGKTRTWKSRPGDFKIPMKHGLKECFYIDQVSAAEWTLSESEARGDLPLGYMQGRGAA